MSQLAACLCFKDSAQYLGEWLLFHQVQGVEHFYLYNNESTDNWREVVKPWLDRGLATAIDFPGVAAQMAIYADCLERTRGRERWVAFLDDDEFLFPVVEEPLPAVIEEYAAHAGLGVSWVLVGSGGVEQREPGWVTRRFTHSAGGPDAHIKCIVRPERVTRPLVVGHMFETVPGVSIVDERGNAVTEPLNPSPSVNRLRLNHYLVKSWEEWRFRRLRPHADTGRPTPHPEASWRDWDRHWSSVPDQAAARYHGRMEALARELGLGAERGGG